jgi:hypothetical protein
MEARYGPQKPRDGRWRFVERRVHVDLIGDVSRHLRQDAVEAISSAT